MDNQQVDNLVTWKVLKDFPKYEISNTGIIRNVKTKSIKYTTTDKDGYIIVMFKKDKKTYARKVHRLVGLNFLDPPSEELITECSKKGSGLVLINHKDGVKSNNNVLNLEWCDDSYNLHHAISNNLWTPNVGQQNGRAKLCDEKVHEICLAYEGGMTPKEAEAVFGISKQQASKIKCGINWNHIWKQYNIKVKRRSTSTTIP